MPEKGAHPERTQPCSTPVAQAHPPHRRAVRPRRRLGRRRSERDPAGHRLASQVQRRHPTLARLGKESEGQQERCRRAGKAQGSEHDRTGKGRQTRQGTRRQGRLLRNRQAAGRVEGAGVGRDRRTRRRDRRRQPRSHAIARQAHPTSCSTPNPRPRPCTAPDRQPSGKGPNESMVNYLRNLGL